MKRKRDSPDAATTSAFVDDGDSSSSGAEFEVFLSFRGPDTRLNFTDCLYHSLRSQESGDGARRTEAMVKSSTLLLMRF
ncbi:hypothetical protein NL676_008997 [Syzygium grande]|nr:hypothetical protein NL676_008997 [Syzygium grande]